MTKARTLREALIMCVTLLALFYAGKSIYGSVERQVFLHDQAGQLKKGQEQASEVNKELRDGLANYRSSKGIDRLARERLNLVGKDEIQIRIGK